MKWIKNIIFLGQKKKTNLKFSSKWIQTCFLRVHPNGWAAHVTKVAWLCTAGNSTDEQNPFGSRLHDWSSQASKESPYSSDCHRMDVASALISSGQASFGNLCSAILSACLSNIKKTKTQSMSAQSAKYNVESGQRTTHSAQITANSVLQAQISYRSARRTNITFSMCRLHCGVWLVTCAARSDALSVMCMRVTCEVWCDSCGE